MWSLCDNPPAFKENPLIKSDDEFEDWLLEDTRRMVHQGMLDNCEDYFVSAADLEQAQEPLKPTSIGHLYPIIGKENESMMVIFQPNSFATHSSIPPNMVYYHLLLTYRQDSSLPTRF